MKKSNLRLRSAVAMLSLGSVLLIIGFCIPPPGEINNSVLVAFGEILTFSGTLLGIEFRSRQSQPNKPQN